MKTPVLASRVPPFPPRVVLLVGILAVSVSAILIRLAQAEAPSLSIATGRLLVASLLLLPWTLSRRRAELRRMTAGQWRLGLLAGVVLAIHFASWVSSLAFTTVASSTVLVATSPLWVGLASPFLLGESLSREMKGGIGLALAGSAIIGLFEAGGGRGGSNPVWGNALALVGAWAAAAYLMIGRRQRVTISLLTYSTVVYGTAALVLLAWTLASGSPLLGFSLNTYLLIVLMALAPQLLGHQAFNWSLAYLPASYVSVTTVSEPVGAGLLALLIFGELPGPGVLIGGVLILAGILIASKRTTPPLVIGPE